jgi:hypothetical protein
MARITKTLRLPTQPFPSRFGIGNNERFRQKSRVLDGQFKLDAIFQDQHEATD